MATKKRLIDANAFRQNLEVDRFGYTDIVKVNIALDKSTVDAVEVVRCKDCKHSMKSNLQLYEKRTHLCTISLGGLYHELNHFCSYGERRTEDG